jgi:phage terminase small subunit
MPRVKQPLGSPLEDVPARIKAIWEELRDSVPDGLLGEGDRPLVEAYCTSVYLCEGLAAKLHRNGKNGQLSEWNQLVRLMIRLMATLGISPEARSRMNAPAAEKQVTGWEGVG